MSMHLLPPYRGRAETSFAQAVAGQFPIASPARDLWNPDACPAHLLPWLAWALSVDDWDVEWPEATKRRVIAESVKIHRHKGSVASVRRILRAQGWVLDDPFFTTLHDGLDGPFYEVFHDDIALHDDAADYNQPWFVPRVTYDGGVDHNQPYFEFGAELIERYGHEVHDGAHRYNGAINHDDADHWAEYRLRIFRQITTGQAAAIRRALDTVAPARCHLRALNYPEALHRYNGAIAHDDTFTHGEA